MSEKDRADEILSPAEEITEEELARMRSLLKDAYPGPDRDIRPAVEAAIRRERAEARRARFVRWGGLAACLALIVMSGFFALSNGLIKKAAPADSLSEECYDMSGSPAEDAVPNTLGLTAASGPMDMMGEPEQDGDLLGRSFTASIFTSDQKSKGDTDVPEYVITEEEACEAAVCENAYEEAPASAVSFEELLCRNLMTVTGDDTGDGTPVPDLIASNAVILTEETVSRVWDETVEEYENLCPGMPVPDYHEITNYFRP